MRTWTKRSVTTGFLALALSAVGCAGTSYQKFDLTVKLDEDFRQQTRGAVTSVDVVALSDQRAERLEDMSMREYWTRDHPYRENLDKDGILWTRDLSASNPSVTLPSSDPIWNTDAWETGARLFILANIPGVGAQDGMDPRRVSVPRDSELWTSDQLEVIFGRGEPRYSPQPKVSGQ